MSYYTLFVLKVISVLILFIGRIYANSFTITCYGYGSGYCNFKIVDGFALTSYSRIKVSVTSDYPAGCKGELCESCGCEQSIDPPCSGSMLIPAEHILEDRCMLFENSRPWVGVDVAFKVQSSSMKTCTYTIEVSYNCNYTFYGSISYEGYKTDEWRYIAIPWDNPYKIYYFNVRATVGSISFPIEAKDIVKMSNYTIDDPEAVFPKNIPHCQPSWHDTRCIDDIYFEGTDSESIKYNATKVKSIIVLNPDDHKTRNGLQVHFTNIVPSDWEKLMASPIAPLIIWAIIVGSAGICALGVGFYRGWSGEKI